MYDAIVIGAGPAGSTAARKLGELGLNTALVEKNTNRDKPCGGLLTSAVLKRYKIDEDVIVRKIHGLNIYGINESLHINLPKPGASVYRKKFDRFLLENALPYVDFFHSKGEVNIKNDKVVVKAGGKVIEGEILIAANGSPSSITKQLGLKKNNDYATAIQYDILLENEAAERRIGDNFDVYLGKSVSPFGYGWIAPKVNGSVYVGTGCHISHLKGSIKSHLDYLFHGHPICREKLKGGRIKRTMGWIIPTKIAGETYSDRALLVGDAAGFATPFMGEGIYYAMVSGELAAETCAEAHSIGDFSTNTLKLYEKYWKRDFGADFGREGILTSLLVGKDWLMDRFIARSKESERIKRLMMESHLKEGLSFFDLIKAIPAIGRMLF